MTETDNLTPEEKHAIWQNNACFLYDRLVIQKLKWPSLVFQWLPFREDLLEDDAVKYQFLYSSHSSGSASLEHLYIAEVVLPNLKNIDQQGGQQRVAKISTIFKFNHEQQINMARYCVENPDIIATRFDNAPVSIFQKGAQYPVCVLEGELAEGFALDWKPAGLLTGDTKGSIYVWKNVEQRPLTMRYNQAIGDTKWVTENVFASVSDDGFLNFWDIRTGNIVEGAKQTRNDKNQLYVVSPNPEHHHLVLTGGEDTIVRIWDTRNLRVKLFNFQEHNDSVVSLQWSPVNPSVFASGSTDCTVKIWDFLRVGFEVPKDLDGTDQILFTHEGHRGKINDISWNHHQMMLGSVQEDNNTLQIYQIANTVHELEYRQDMDYLRQQCFS